MTDLHERDRTFLAWLRDPATTRGALVRARELAFKEWQFVACQRELDRREGKLAAHARR